MENKKKGFIKNNPISRFVRESYIELKKVAWPKRSEVIKKTILVFVSMIIVAAIIGALDYGLYQGAKILINFR